MLKNEQILIDNEVTLFIQFSLPTVSQKQETMRQTPLVPTSAESGEPTPGAKGICPRRAWQPQVQTFATDAVLGKAPSQPPCGEDTGNKESIVLPTEMEVLRRAQGNYLPPTGHTSSRQVLCSCLFSSFLFRTVSDEIRPISLTFVPRGSQCGVSLKFCCLRRSPASATVEFSKPCQRWSSLIFLPERKKTVLFRTWRSQCSAEGE